MTSQDRTDIHCALTALQELLDGIGHDTDCQLVARLLIVDNRSQVPDVHRLDELLALVPPYDMRGKGI